MGVALGETTFQHLRSGRTPGGRVHPTRFGRRLHCSPHNGNRHWTTYMVICVSPAQTAGMLGRIWIFAVAWCGSVDFPTVGPILCCYYYYVLQPTAIDVHTIQKLSMNHALTTQISGDALVQVYRCISFAHFWRWDGRDGRMT